MSGLDIYGLRKANKIVRDTRSLMKGQSGDYVNGWRSALNQVESLIKIKIGAIKGEQTTLVRGEK